MHKWWLNRCVKFCIEIPSGCWKKTAKDARGLLYFAAPGMGSATLHIAESSAPCPQIFLRHPACAYMVWETVTKFCMVIKLDEKKIFYRVDFAPLRWPKYFVTRMLTGDLSAVPQLSSLFSVIMTCDYRNAYRARYCFTNSVRLSVRLSVTLWYCI